MPSEGLLMRTPTDGEPYYCTFCGSGWNEYCACEDVRCVLETCAEAKSRSKDEEPPEKMPLR
jgi:hypothetical protein